MIKIDFHGSTHGHFLEYVSNVYIMQTTPSECSIFKAPTYSAHAANSNYLKDRIIECGHFSSNFRNLKIDPADTVIRIKLDPSDDGLFFIALSNLMYKAGDVGFERQQTHIPEHIRNNPVSVRNDWYSKINERDKFASHYNNFPAINNPTFDFSFRAFFSFTEFCTELASLAMFLNQTFCPDATLYQLWSTFIRVNQGWQSYNKCNDILINILSNQESTIDCTSLEEAWINFNLSKTCRLFEGPTFEQDVYPISTKIIYKIVQNQLRSH